MRSTGAAARSTGKARRGPRAAPAARTGPAGRRRRAALLSPAAQDTVQTLAKPEAVILEGIVATANLGGYSLAYNNASQDLSVSVPRANPRIGGYYAVAALPVGEWFVLTDRHGSLLPVAVQKIHEHAYQVRVDSASLQGLRAVTSIPGY
jgi:hypothetical protein